MLEGGEYSPSPEPFSCMSTLTNSRKKKSKNKRRFTDEQIRSLETMFESESRLEPRKKLQVARDLGLQPRQVAIWFQNRRARWKSKQLERDCGILQANYNSLASRFETLKKEKQALLLQLQKLNELLQKTQGERQNIETEFEVKPCLSLENSEPGGLGVLSDDDSSIKAEYFGIDEEQNFMSMVKPADSSLTSPEDWGSFDSDGLFDQSSNNYQWWDFWS